MFSNFSLKNKVWGINFNFYTKFIYANPRTLYGQLILLLEHMNCSGKKNQFC